MMQFLEANHLLGLLIGICTFLIIGLFHPLVIQAEYRYGTRSWWFFLVVGALFLLLSLWFDSVLWSALSGVTAFSSFWSIKEVFQQEERVRKGWFPKNPRRTYKF